MRRMLALALTMTSATAIACGGSAPTSPTPAAVVSSVLGMGIAHPSMVAPSDASAATAPGAPVGLTASAAGSTVTLTWNPPASGDAASYLIEAGSAPGLADLANFPSGAATTFSASGVGAGTYYVRVRAVSSGGVSSPSNEAILVVGATGCTSSPNAPSGLTSTVSGSSLGLFWSAPASGCAPTGYVIEAGSTPGSSSLANFNTGSTATAFTTSGVGAGTYYVRVRAFNAAGASGSSNEATVVVGSGPPQPPPTSTPTASTRWVGVLPDGVIVDYDPLDQCPAEYDLQLDLTTSGTTVTGTALTRLRRVEAAGPCHDVLGQIATWGVINGTVGSGTISFALGSGTFRFSGTFTATRMTGTVFLQESTPYFQRGSFAVTRQ